MTFVEEMELLVNSRAGVVQVLTHDEQRLVETLTTVCRGIPGPRAMGLYTWDLADNFREVVRGEPAFDCSKGATVDTVLPMIENAKGPAVFLLRDFHQVWDAKKTAQRKLRNLVQTLPRSLVNITLVISTPPDLMPMESRHPAGLKQDIVSLELGKPDADELCGIMGRVLGNEMPSGELGCKLCETALGLSGVHAARVAARVFTYARLHDRKVDETALDMIREEKRRIIRDSGALDFVDATEQVSSVGGLESLRDWLDLRKEAFSERAAAYGLAAPGGVALVGIPGTGKSLCAKVTASMWRMPLLRLDMGAVFGGVLGSSERNIREAMEISELVSPCILWVDEIEKAFAGSGGDSGTAARVLGTFLTWMQEKAKPVCVFATANDVELLPPEFLRKGRFDEVFFLDLPTREERRAIFAVHLGKRGYSMTAQRFDLERVIDVTEGFVGAEIEAVVKDAMFPAFMDHEREIETDDLVKSAGEMVPLAKSRAKHIEKLRKLVIDGEARNASFVVPEKEVKFDMIRGERIIQLD
jgi:SpoVK/Ycf46/Vps4 family AAA+-type ATPase